MEETYTDKQQRKYQVERELIECSSKNKNGSCYLYKFAPEDGECFTIELHLTGVALSTEWVKDKIRDRTLEDFFVTDGFEIVKREVEERKIRTDYILHIYSDQEIHYERTKHPLKKHSKCK